MSDEPAAIQRNVARLAAERTELFSRSIGVGGLSSAARSRLRAIERQLDECYTALRLGRAGRANARQRPHDVTPRRAVVRRHP
jgi:hypothetical protein